MNIKNISVLWRISRCFCLLKRTSGKPPSPQRLQSCKRFLVETYIYKRVFKLSICYVDHCMWASTHYIILQTCLQTNIIFKPYSSSVRLFTEIVQEIFQRKWPRLIIVAMSLRASGATTPQDITLCHGLTEDLKSQENYPVETTTKSRNKKMVVKCFSSTSLNQSSMETPAEGWGAGGAEVFCAVNAAGTTTTRKFRGFLHGRPLPSPFSRRTLTYWNDEMINTRLWLDRKIRTHQHYITWSKQMPREVLGRSIFHKTTFRVFSSRLERLNRGSFLLAWWHIIDQQFWMKQMLVGQTWHGFFLRAINVANAFFGLDKKNHHAD